MLSIRVAESVDPFLARGRPQKSQQSEVSVVERNMRESSVVQGWSDLLLPGASRPDAVQ